MRHSKLTIIGILLMLSTSTTLAKEPLDCLEKALTQKEMNNCANINFKEVDAELNRVYYAIQQKYIKNKAFLKNLKEAQRLWIKLRDADFSMQFPHSKEAGYYGSIFPLCADDYKAELTLKRIEFLKQWLIGAEEGQSCRGSQALQITDDIPQTKNESEIEQVCYANVIPYNDNKNTNFKDITELTLNINYGDGSVKGKYNYLPAEKDQRFGEINGSLWKGAISAEYTYEQEGETNSINVRIRLDDEKAIVQGEVKDKILSVSDEIKKIPCQ
ncbi:MAG: Unknown protein [uncultured Sulfurovum sp.]|uniref:Lysozyme inhibitor LprI-like N-terminal domain-containing protein n=1 Tax=uncultured Sulfurovum sp. TaxID=269237 RepID=A0A6S6TWV5_9BACT|nr:MAG: Unknown protein [uncultured Sulfurovum sp.]